MRYNPLVRANSIQNALTAIDAEKSFALTPSMKHEVICDALKVININPTVAKMTFTASSSAMKTARALSFLQECRIS